MLARPPIFSGAEGWAFVVGPARLEGTRARVNRPPRTENTVPLMGSLSSGISKMGSRSALSAATTSAVGGGALADFIDSDGTHDPPCAGPEEASVACGREVIHGLPN